MHYDHPADGEYDDLGPEIRARESELRPGMVKKERPGIFKGSPEEYAEVVKQVDEDRRRRKEGKKHA